MTDDWWLMIDAADADVDDADADAAEQMSI